MLKHTQEKAHSMRQHESENAVLKIFVYFYVCLRQKRAPGAAGAGELPDAIAGSDLGSSARAACILNH